MATDALDALSKYEWVEAARLALHIDRDADLRLLEVRAKADSSGEGSGAGSGAGSGEDGGEAWEGFIGETSAVRVRVVEGASGEQREAALFLKVVPSGNRVREALAVGTRAFHKEVGYFDLVERLLPRLRAGAPPHWGPRCLLAHPRALVFEDLGAQGYRTLGLRSTLDFAHCAAALDAVARLHATSLAAEEIDRRTRHVNPWRLGDRFPDPLQEVMFTDTFWNILSKYIAVGVKPIKTLISLMPQYRDSPRYKEILERADQVPKIAYKVVKASDKYRNVLCHGDLWVNNIMFRYSSWGQVEEARLVDFQLTRYAPPALDVEMLLQMCTRRALRDAHAHELRATYYEALDRALTGAGFRASDLLPRAEFDASCRIGGAFARFATASYFPGDQLPADIIGPIMDSEDDLERYLVEERCQFVREAWSRDPEYKERLSEVISELVDNLLLAEDDFFK